jgi:hypothetical protein
MKTIVSSIGFQDDSGTLLANGSLILNLPSGVMFLISAGGGQVVGRVFIINLDATGKVPAGITIWASDELAGAPLYSATLCQQANGLQPVGSVRWLIGGSSPIDLSLLTQH